MKHIEHHHIKELLDAGYAILEAYINDQAPGHVIVADPVLCISGNKRWAEVQRVTLRTPQQVFKFIADRA